MENTGGEEGRGEGREGREGEEEEKRKGKERKTREKRRKKWGSTTRQTSKGYSQNFFLIRCGDRKNFCEAPP